MHIFQQIMPRSWNKMFISWLQKNSFHRQPIVHHLLTPELRRFQYKMQSVCIDLADFKLNVPPVVVSSKGCWQINGAIEF